MQRRRKAGAHLAGVRGGKHTQKRPCDAAEKPRRQGVARPGSEDPSPELAWWGPGGHRGLRVRPGDWPFICNSPSVHMGADLAQEEAAGDRKQVASHLGGGRQVSQVRWLSRVADNTKKRGPSQASPRPCPGMRPPLPASCPPSPRPWKIRPWGKGGQCACWAANLGSPCPHPVSLAPGGVPSHRATLPNSRLPPWLRNVSPSPTDGAKRKPLGFELTLLFCKCEFYKALYK